MLRILLCWAAVGAVLAGAAEAKPKIKIPPSSDPPWIGIGIQQGRQGVLVIEVIDGTPAASVGLELGDEILRVGGAVVRTPTELEKRVKTFKVGDSVELVLLRGSRRYTVKPQLSARLDANELMHRRLVDKPAPDFDLPVVEGVGSGKLSDYQGKVVVLEFWATWCSACKTTYGDLARLQAEYSGDLQVLGITSESSTIISRFLSNYSLGFGVLRDPGATVFRRSYWGQHMPTLIVIDRNGIIRHAGFGAGVNLDNAIYAAKRALRKRRLF
jgi:peroxiredoxin